MLGTLLDFNSDASYKQDRFSKVLIKKNFKFALSRWDGIVIFNLSFILLLTKVDLILEE